MTDPKITKTWCDTTDVSSRMKLYAEQCRKHLGNRKPDDMVKCPHCFSCTIDTPPICGNPLCNLPVDAYLPGSARPPVEMRYVRPAQSVARVAVVPPAVDDDSDDDVFGKMFQVDSIKSKPEPKLSPPEPEPEDDDVFDKMFSGAK